MLGSWGNKFTLTVIAIHMLHLPDGRILLWDYGGWPNLTTPSAKIWHYKGDPQNWITPMPNFHNNMFCGGIDSTGATGITEVIDVTQDNPQWVTTAPMNYPRRDHTLVIGPEGKVYAFNGSNANNQPVLIPEVWDPVEKTWTPLASMATAQCDPRMYHSVAMLLRTALFVVAGGDGYNTAQIYTPDYLVGISEQQRPQIISIEGVSPDVIRCASVFTVNYQSGEDPIVKVTLLRLGPVTHGFDSDQRFLSLPFVIGIDIETGLPSGQLAVTAPPNAFHAPPGDYMLFIFSLINGKQVPSVARYVKIWPFTTG